ncbi:MAG: iron chelate uptake ABC transporter family permease subunit, partial [Lachnospiraceae bacterium]|nr:iron chelate uptake ABC transporter family permease subunit [Lachnospiraceae bacterium]
PWLVIIIPFLIYHSRDLNLLRLSDGVAIGLGSPLKRNRFLYLMLAVALAAACVSVGGAIGFVGLICPHLACKLVGPNHQYCIPVSAATGAILLLAADLVARTVIAPGEMLLGIVVSLIGAPYFLYILLTSKS